MAKISSVFTRRLETHLDELKWLYMELYNDQRAFAWFLSMLERMYTKRDISLRRLDRKREKNPNWYKDRSTLGMLMYTQCFGGTLKAIIREINQYIYDDGGSVA